MVRLMLVLGLVLSLAACSSGGTDGLSKSEEADLQARLEAAEAERLKAEEARRQAELEKARAELEQARAETEAERQRLEAERQRLAAEAARREQERLEEEAEQARLDALVADASVALAGLSSGTPLDPPTSVTPKYRAPAGVSVPNATFTSPSGSQTGRWYATTAYNRGPTNEDSLVIYSDVAAPESVPIMQIHEDFGEDTDNANLLAITIADTHANLIASSRFPTGGRTENVAPTIDTDDPPDGNDLTANIPGTFDGASGNYQCASTTPCTVRHTGAGYVLGAGTWTFRTSKSAKVRDPDDDFMYFGWWRRKTNETGALAYGSFSSTNGGSVSGGSGFGDLTGSATYEGPAIGQYAIYQPLGTQSNHGEFKATARFVANFDTDMLSGDVFGFDVSSGWALTLEETSMSGGSVTAGTVSWAIDGNTQAGGAWTGTFHSEIDPYAGHIPDGLTGTFTAEYDDVGRIRGAYGAHVK